MQTLTYDSDGNIYDVFIHNLPQIFPEPGMYIKNYEGYVSGDKHYIDILTTNVMQKAVLAVNANKAEILSNGIDELILSGLPNCKIFDGLNYHIVTDGEFVITRDMPGSYKLIIKSTQFLDHTFTYTVI